MLEFHSATIFPGQRSTFVQRKVQDINKKNPNYTCHVFGGPRVPNDQCKESVHCGHSPEITQKQNLRGFYHKCQWMYRRYRPRCTRQLFVSGPEISGVGQQENVGFLEIGVLDFAV